MNEAAEYILSVVQFINMLIIFFSIPGLNPPNTTLQSLQKRQYILWEARFDR